MEKSKELRMKFFKVLDKVVRKDTFEHNEQTGNVALEAMCWQSTQLI